MEEGDAYCSRIAFEELGLHRVYLNVLTENIRANAFYKKAGFQFEREEKDAVEIKGVSKSLNWYAISKKRIEYAKKSSIYNYSYCGNYIRSVNMGFV